MSDAAALIKKTTSIVVGSSSVLSDQSPDDINRCTSEPRPTCNDFHVVGHHPAGHRLAEQSPQGVKLDDTSSETAGTEFNSADQRICQQSIRGSTMGEKSLSCSFPSHSFSSLIFE